MNKPEVLRSMHIIALEMERNHMTRNGELDLVLEDVRERKQAYWARRWSKYCQYIEQRINSTQAQIIGRNPNWLFKGDR